MSLIDKLTIEQREYLVKRNINPYGIEFLPADTVCLFEQPEYGSKHQWLTLSSHQTVKLPLEMQGEYEEFFKARLFDKPNSGSFYITKDQMRSRGTSGFFMMLIFVMPCMLLKNWIRGHFSKEVNNG